MLNIKSYGKGIRLRKSDANCFESISDPRLVWMDKFVLWLHCWNRYNVQHDCGLLSKETYLALTLSAHLLYSSDICCNIMY